MAKQTTMGESVAFIISELDRLPPHELSGLIRMLDRLSTLLYEASVFRDQGKPEAERRRKEEAAELEYAIKAAALMVDREAGDR